MKLYDKINEHLIKQDSVNIVIAGCTCSGKTTLAKDIFERFSNDYKVTIFEQDAYFKNLEDIPRTRYGYLTDSIHAFHKDEFIEDVEELLSSCRVLIPRYDISTNTRISKDKFIEKGNINIFEGLHTISLLYSLNCSIKIFIDTDINECLKRRINRDKELYKIPEIRIKEYFKDCILPMYNKFILPQKNFADLTI